MPHTIDIDIRGQICPSCLLIALKELNSHAMAIRAHESELAMVTDDCQATVTIPAAALRMGLGAEVQDLDDSYRIRIFGNS